MNKRYKALYLNGLNKGKEIEVEVPYTEEDEQRKKDKLKFNIDGIEYAGWCRCCNQPVREAGAWYIINVDGVGNLLVDVYHKYCL